MRRSIPFALFFVALLAVPGFPGGGAPAPGGDYHAEIPGTDDSGNDQLTLDSNNNAKVTVDYVGVIPPGGGAEDELVEGQDFNISGNGTRNPVIEWLIAPPDENHTVHVFGDTDKPGTTQGTGTWSSS